MDEDVDVILGREQRTDVPVADEYGWTLRLICLLDLEVGCVVDLAQLATDLLLPVRGTKWQTAGG